MICRDTERMLEPYVDGELDAGQLVAVDQHTAGCFACAERVAFRRAMKNEVRRIGGRTRAPSSLRARIAQSTAGGAVQREAPALPSKRDERFNIRSAIPWVAAAGVALAAGGGLRTSKAGPGTAQLSSMSASGGYEQLLDRLVSQHARTFPPEELDPARIHKVFSPIVGVPVRPAQFDTMQPHVPFQFAGGRLMPIGDEPIATLYYDYNGARVTLFVFDPHRITMNGSCCLVPHIVESRGEERTIYMGHAKGYALALYEHDGIGYAVSGDIDERNVLALAASL